MPVPEETQDTNVSLRLVNRETAVLGSVGPLTFALKHADQLGSHGHSHIGDEAGGDFLGV